MAVCFAADCKHSNLKDMPTFFRFPSNTKEYKKWEDSIYQILIPAKKGKKFDRQCKQKISWTALCHLKMS